MAVVCGKTMMIRCGYGSSLWLNNDGKVWLWQQFVATEQWSTMAWQQSVQKKDGQIRLREQFVTKLGWSDTAMTEMVEYCLGMTDVYGKWRMVKYGCALTSSVCKRWVVK